MAVLSTTPGASAFGASLAQRITSLLDDVTKARNAAHEFDRLSNLSDARLAELGLNRSDIAAHVGKLYL